MANTGKARRDKVQITTTIDGQVQPPVVYSMLQGLPHPAGWPDTVTEETLARWTTAHYLAQHELFLQLCGVPAAERTLLLANCEYDNLEGCPLLNSNTWIDAPTLLWEDTIQVHLRFPVSSEPAPTADLTIHLEAFPLNGSVPLTAVIPAGSTFTYVEYTFQRALGEDYEARLALDTGDGYNVGFPNAQSFTITGQ